MTGFEDQYRNLKKIGILNNKNIIVKNKDNVEKLLSKFFGGSFSDLQLVFDYDYTLTRGRFHNDDSLCSWGIMDNSPLMPPFYREKAFELLHKYHPIEIDPVLTVQEKVPHMVRWYEDIQDLLKRCSVTKEVVKNMVTTSSPFIRFRDGTSELFSLLHREGVPLLILSAGMGDILQYVLDHFQLTSSNIKVVSNFFKYNGEGVMDGFDGSLIHVFNKNENAIHSSEYFDILRSRKNVLLAGDSLGDVQMANGVSADCNVLKIGFFNYAASDAKLSQYVDAYDIVLVTDQTMDVVNAILRQVDHPLSTNGGNTETISNSEKYVIQS